MGCKEAASNTFLQAGSHIVKNKIIFGSASGCRTKQLGKKIIKQQSLGMYVHDCSWYVLGFLLLLPRLCVSFCGFFVGTVGRPETAVFRMFLGMRLVNHKPNRVLGFKVPLFGYVCGPSGFLIVSSAMLNCSRYARRLNHATSQTHTKLKQAQQRDFRLSSSAALEEIESWSACHKHKVKKLKMSTTSFVLHLPLKLPLVQITLTRHCSCSMLLHIPSNPWVAH